MTENRIKISAVSYLNTKPMLWGLLRSKLKEKIDLQLNIPSVSAAKLEVGEVDLALVPVAIIPHLKNPEIISDFCIGTEGAVETVGIFSELPIEELDTIYLDYHSRTSVKLAQVLVRDYWKTDVVFIPASEGFEANVGGKTGAVIIGDRTMGLIGKYNYFYDLGDVWMKHTGLPFVFAAWVTTRNFDPDFIEKFNLAIQNGIDHINDLMLILPEKDNFDLEKYFTHHISYHLDNKKRRALNLFLEKISTLKTTK